MWWGGRWSRVAHWRRCWPRSGRVIAWARRCGSGWRCARTRLRGRSRHPRPRRTGWHGCGGRALKIDFMRRILTIYIGVRNRVQDDAIASVKDRRRGSRRKYVYARGHLIGAARAGTDPAVRASRTDYHTHRSEGFSRILRARRNPTKVIVHGNPADRARLKMVERSGAPHPSVSGPIDPVSVVIRQPSPRFGADPHPSVATEIHPTAGGKWQPIGRHPIGLPAISGAGHIGPVSVVREIGGVGSSRR